MFLTSPFIDQAITPTTDAHSMAALLAFASLGCKLGSVAPDGTVVSTTASSVSQIHADIAAIWALTASF